MLTIALVSLITIILSYWFYERYKLRKCINEIPGPPGSIIFGNIFDLICSPVELFNNIRTYSKQYYPIYKIWSGHKPAVTLLTPEDVELLLSSMAHIEKSLIYECLQPWLGTGLLTSTGKKWQMRRKLLTPAFHFNILKQFTKVFGTHAQRLVEELENECTKEYTDVVPFITKFTLDSICETAMGTQLAATNSEYRWAIYKMGELLVYRICRPWLYPSFMYCFTLSFWENKRTAKKLHKFSEELIEQRKASAQSQHFDNLDDMLNEKKKLAMLDLLLYGQNTGFPIDDEGILEEVDTFMFEGHDTTTMSISFTLFLLANHSDVQEKVVSEIKDVFDVEKTPSIQQLQDLKYLEMVLKESLRLYPSVHFISRVLGETMHTRTGYTLPKGCTVNVPIYDLHRNEKYFPDPYTFNPDRFLPENVLHRHPYAYIPFSAGPRNCIGQKFAMLELKSAIAKILLNFKLHPVDKPQDLEFVSDLILRTSKGLKLKFEKRN